MAELKTVGVKELKNNLSAYLREVRRGIRVLVSDRNRVVAELHEPRTAHALDDPLDPRIAEWIETGIVRPPTAERTKLPESPVKLGDAVAARLLDQDRGDTDR
jgi:antitoxin (DNA-binding transcriptional repressor) of toxin-antitoxin stability system